MEVLQVKAIDKIYGKKETAVHALKNVSFSVSQGEFIAIVGSSGSGKSTLLNLIGGLDVPTGGEIVIRNHNIASLTRKELTIFRRRNIGFVFQNYSLMPVLNVYDNVALPVTFDRGRHVDHAYLKNLLLELGLWEKRKSYPSELSGGQQQRAALARALANKPAIILADEPTGNLDSRTAVEVIGLLKNSARQYRQTILMVTHNEALAQTCDRILHIEDGVLLTAGNARMARGDKAVRETADETARGQERSESECSKAIQEMIDETPHTRKRSESECAKIVREKADETPHGQERSEGRCMI